MTQNLEHFAHRLADAATDVIRPYFRTNVSIDDKADDSPVTAADRSAETKMRDLIEAAFPDHGIFGEEHGIKEGNGTDMWVLDPIDGTRSFICGAPWFGTLIAYVKNARPKIGVINIPMMQERWVGDCKTATHNGKQTRVRTGVPLSEASLFTTDMDLFETQQQAVFNRLKQQVKCTRYGTDCYAYGLLASGHIDLVVEAGLQPYDAMALVPVIEGAGGIVTGWNGEEITLSWDGRIVAAASKDLHKETLALLNQ